MDSRGFWLIIIDPDQRGWEYPDRGVRFGDNQEKDNLLALPVSTKKLGPQIPARNERH